MAIQEPTSALGLWPRVKAITGWPDTDETAMVDLFFGWLDGAESVGTLASVDLSALAGAWPDAAGRALMAELGEVMAALGESKRQMTELAGRAGTFALEVEHVKNHIHEAINASLPFYGLASIAPTFIGRDMQDSIVDEVAAGITAEMTASAARIGSRGPVDVNDIIARLAEPRSFGEGVLHAVQDNANTLSAFADVSGDVSTVLSAASDYAVLAGPPGLMVKGVAEGASTVLGGIALGGHLLALAGGADVRPETLMLDFLGLESPLGTPVLAEHLALEASEHVTGELKSTIVDDVNKYWLPNPDALPRSGIDPVLGSYNPVLNASTQGGALDLERRPDLVEERARSRGQG
ncbi:hypothetical protein LZG04_39325 [Saccharothrix sp. S26]|uniref:WXG100-like domain-containing protein n=1 Tax=Saccharothrix sp. S26 TaxID=2907215 RepID=UPI001F19892E|nr:hypothetical protein [Saccharothrix sp. S26]MCE7000827.1 hypothetical protein [Saccharothrix sp. S26]